MIILLNIVFIVTMINLFDYINFDDIASLSIISTLLERSFSDMIKNLWDKFAEAKSLSEKEEILKEIKRYSREAEAAIKESKRNYSVVERWEARRDRREAKRKALQQFFNSDLYSIACAILGFDIKQKLKSIALNSKWITIRNHPTVNPTEFTMNHFTLDIEAYLDKEGKFVPYFFGVYGEEFGFKSFYGSNCMGDAIKFILNYNYSSTEVTFFAHNGGRFDYLYVIKELNSQGIDSLRVLKDKQNAIFCISFEHNGYNFTFKDSFKLMPLGLDKLLKDFGINVGRYSGKLPFDHSWINADNLYYKGPTPSWLIHMQKELIDMDVIQNGEFSIERYCFEYNKVDCEGLHKLIFKFFHSLVLEFKIDFSYCSTLAQLSLEVYRSVFLRSNKLIRLLSTRHHNFIKKSYIGSIVSVFKPYGERLFGYDINSLYPYCMLKDMPTGTPRPFDVSKGLDALEMGFAYAEVTCPADLKIPVLGKKANVNGTEKLIFPSGTFRSVFFSEELRYAKSLGYEIKLIKALSFNKSENLFTRYVNYFYHKKSTGTGATKAIAKLLLNTLYGRMGIRKEFESCFITSNNSMKEQVLKLFTNVTPEPLSGESVLFNFNISPNPNLKDSYILELLQKLFFMTSEGRVGNIALASAITAYARIEHHKYMRMVNYDDVYYADTDSLFISRPLNADLIGDKIGQFKNVLADANYTIGKDADYYISKGLFLRDKVYSVVLKDGSQITKFSGLNRKLVPSNSFELLYDAYLTGNPVKLKNEILRRDINNLMVSHVELDKVFTFNYDKRLQVYDINGKWVDTLAININKPGVNISQLVRKQQVALNDQIHGLAQFTGTINQAAICDSNYKHFDGYFLNYILPMRQDPVSTLKELIELASKEGVLVPGVHYLITEYYGFRKNTINYLTNYVSEKELLNIYSQHIDSVLNSGISIPLKEEGEDSSVYIVDKLSLRIRIPSEYRPKSD